MVEIRYIALASYKSFNGPQSSTTDFEKSFKYFYKLGLKFWLTKFEHSLASRNFLSHCLYLYLSASLCASLPISLYIYIFRYSYVYIFIYIYIYLNIYIYIYIYIDDLMFFTTSLFTNDCAPLILYSAKVICNYEVTFRSKNLKVGLLPSKKIASFASF